MTLKLSTMALGGLLLLAVPTPNLSARQEGANAPAAAESRPAAGKKRGAEAPKVPLNTNPKMVLDTFLAACVRLAEERAASPATYPSPEGTKQLAQAYGQMCGLVSVAVGDEPNEELMALAKLAAEIFTTGFDKVKDKPTVLAEPVAKDAKGIAIIPQPGTPEAVARDFRVVGMLSMSRLTSSPFGARQKTAAEPLKELVSKLQELGATPEQIDDYHRKMEAANKKTLRPDRQRRGNNPAQAPALPEVNDPSELPLKVLESRVAQLESQVAAASPGPDKERLEKELAFYQKRLAEKRVKELGIEKPKDGAAPPAVSPEGTPK